MKEEEECLNSGPKSCLDKLPMFHRFKFKKGKRFYNDVIDVYRNLKIRNHVNLVSNTFPISLLYPSASNILS